MLSLCPKISRGNSYTVTLSWGRQKPGEGAEKANSALLNLQDRSIVLDLQAII